MSRTAATEARDSTRLVVLRDQPDFRMDATGGVAAVATRFIFFSSFLLLKKKGVKTTRAVFRTGVVLI